ncbi:hypothetical protein MTP99_001275 [Tenebrio molitor]|nr:hypothetical protein MTP99_001275 [Tenebrio molitor]
MPRRRPTEVTADTSSVDVARRYANCVVVVLLNRLRRGQRRCRPDYLPFQDFVDTLQVVTDKGTEICLTLVRQV